MKNQFKVIALMLFVFISFFGCDYVGYGDMTIEVPEEKSSKAQNFEIDVEIFKDNFYCIPSLSYTDEVGETIYLDYLENRREIEGPWFTLAIPDEMDCLKVQLDSNSYGFRRELVVYFDNNENFDTQSATITQVAADAEL